MMHVKVVHLVSSMRNYNIQTLHLSFPIHLSKTEHSEISDDRRELFVSNLGKIKCFSKKTWYSSMGNENKQGVIGVKESHSISKK